MSAIDLDLADRIFDGIEKVREGLPTATKLAELLDPKDALLIAGIGEGLTRLFELVVVLQSHPTLEVAASALQDETFARWKAAGQTGPKGPQ